MAKTARMYDTAGVGDEEVQVAWVEVLHDPQRARECRVNSATVATVYRVGPGEWAIATEAVLRPWLRWARPESTLTAAIERVEDAVESWLNPRRGGFR